MLYIPSLINGTPVKVFVDSGAQSTIISQRCAERCGIMRLVDRHFAGTAVGVGTSKIVGRVHMAPLIIAGQHFPCTFVVMESGSIDCLFGLDMLRRYQACIDLHAGVLRLRLGGMPIEVPFLGESEIPKDEVGGDKYEDRDKEDKAAGGSAAASGSGAPAAGAGAGAPASSSSSAMQVDKPAAAASSHGSSAPATSSTAPAGGSAAAPAGGAAAPPAAGAAGGGGAAPLFGPIDLSSLMPPGGRGGRRGR
jgi:DNA damage-inducible protein 1